MRNNKKGFSVRVRNAAFSLAIVICSLLQISVSNAQTATSSPYSRYGLGDLNSKSNGQSFAMGGTGIALQNDSLPMFFINTANPASYCSSRLTTADLGINYQQMQLESSSSKKTINSASLGYLTLAFPFKKWWGACVGLMPYSSVGYKITDNLPINNVGNVDYLYEGSGGINQLFLGNGVKPFYALPRMFTRSSKYKQLVSKTNADNTLKSDSAKRADLCLVNSIMKRRKEAQAISLGVNFSYLFGGIDHSRRTIFPASYGDYNTRTGTTTRVSDVYLDYGLQYTHTIDSVRGRELKRKVKLLFGATFAAQTNINAKTDSLSYNYYDYQGYESVRDTVENNQNYKGKVTLPLSFGVGIGFKKGDRWMVMADWAMQNWSSYQAFNQPGGLKNSMRVSLGAQLVPNSKALQKQYLSRMSYRIGVRYAQTALELKSTQLTEQAITCGFGFPVGRNYLLQNFSMINVGFEVGQRGTVNNDLIKESFFKATLGFTINDRWFVKPKFD